MQDLHKEFVKLGSDRRKLTNKLLAILPEIYEKQIYKKYAGTIVEYAGKFGGLGAEVVKKRLRLEKYVKDKPELKKLIESEGVHKIALIASLATAENENIWADKVKNMSKVALQELSKEMRANSQSLFSKPTEEPLCRAVPVKINLELDEEMTAMFLKLKKKFGGNLTNKEVMKKILEENLERPQNSKLQSEKVIPGDAFEDEKGEGMKVSTRYIPVRIKNKIIAKSHGFCTYPNCNRPAEVFHHRERFANKKSHESLIHLCKIHHEFAHNGLIKNEKFEVREWSLDLSKRELSKIDQLYRQYRR